MTSLKVTSLMCVALCLSVLAISTANPAILPKEEDTNGHGGLILKSLVKRWGEDMFGGCHCSWHVSCMNDTACKQSHGKEYSCRPECCGLVCKHHGYGD